MTIQCQACQHPNPADSRFCNHCGNPMATPTEKQTPDTSVLSDEGQRVIDAFSRDLTEKATVQKIKMLEEFQDKAIRWTKTQFIAATTAITIVAGFFAYIGIKGYNASDRYQQLVKESQEKIHKSLSLIENTGKKIETSSDQILADLKRKTDLVDAKFKLAENTIDEKWSRLEKFDTKQIEAFEIELGKIVARVTALQKKTTDQLARADEQLESIKKLENSRFRILVHFRSIDQESYRQNIDALESVLGEKGFIVNKGNISNVRSDREEILFFSESKHVKQKVKEIHEKLSTGFRVIPMRYESAGSVYPLQVIIKLCSEAKDSSGRCIAGSAAGN